MPGACPDENAILAYLEGQSPPAEARRIEEHLEGCGGCRRLLGDLARGVTGRGGPSEAPAPAEDGEAGAQAPLQPGATLGRYRILRWLGSGGMGVVYEAYDPELDRRVALKLVRPEWAPGELAQAQALVRREARSQARLSHPHVVAVFDVGSVDGQVFIAMELVEGQSLRRWLRAAARPTGEVLRVLLQAGEGLAAAHAAGLVHRDFKPDNVLVSAAGAARVTDFGLAQPSGPPQPAPSALAPAPLLPDGARLRTGAAWGTPAYMAPELRDGAKADPRSDQYAYCVSLYECLYLRHPFHEEGAEEMTARMRRGAPAPPQQRQDTGWVHAILRRGLDPDPARRFPSMTALLEALRRDPSRIRRRRLRLAALLVSLAVGAGGLGAAALMWRGRPGACGGARERLRGVWDAGRREAVRAALLRAGGEGGGAGRLTAALDRYADDWTARHKEVCVATVRRELSPELGDLRMECLDQRRLELEALTALLGAGEPATQQKAEAAVRALASPASCAALSTLALPEPPPRSAEARARIAELRRQAAQIRALLDTDRITEGLALARSALAAAQALGYRPLTAELTVSFAHLLALSGGGGSEAAREPERLLRQAARLAEAARHDQAKVDATIILVDLLKAQDRLEEAEQLVYDARATLDRLGGDERRAVGLDLVLAGIARKRLRPEQGLALLTSAAERIERLEGPFSPALVHVLGSEAEVLNAQLRFEAAEGPARRALAVAERSLGPEHSGALNASVALVDALVGQRRLAEAWELGHRTLARQRRLYPADGVAIAAGAATLGAVLLDLGCPRQALEHVREASQIFSARFPRGYGGAWQVLLLRARAEGALGDHGAARRDAAEVERLLQQEVALGTPRARRALQTLAELRAAEARPAPSPPPACRAPAP